MPNVKYSTNDICYFPLKMSTVSSSIKSMLLKQKYLSPERFSPKNVNLREFLLFFYKTEVKKKREKCNFI